MSSPVAVATEGRRSASRPKERPKLANPLVWCTTEGRRWTKDSEDQELLGPLPPPEPRIYARLSPVYALDSSSSSCKVGGCDEYVGVGLASICCWKLLQSALLNGSLLALPPGCSAFKCSLKPGIVISSSKLRLIFLSAWMSSIGNTPAMMFCRGVSGIASGMLPRRRWMS